MIDTIIKMPFDEFLNIVVLIVSIAACLKSLQIGNNFALCGWAIAALMGIKLVLR
jgi:hypothetical protein